MEDEKELPTADTYTNDWYRQQFGRLNHLYTVLHTIVVDELAKATHQSNALRKEVNELRKDRERDSAKIGELIDVIDQQRVRLDKASDYVKSLNKQKQEAAA
jgi:seryl-tRNA synthetase